MFTFDVSLKTCRRDAGKGQHITISSSAVLADLLGTITDAIYASEESSNERLQTMFDRAVRDADWVVNKVIALHEADQVHTVHS